MFPVLRTLSWNYISFPCMVLGSGGAQEKCMPCLESGSEGSVTSRLQWSTRRQAHCGLSAGSLWLCAAARHILLQLHGIASSCSSESWARECCCSTVKGTSFFCRASSSLRWALLTNRWRRQYFLMGSSLSLFSPSSHLSFLPIYQSHWCWHRHKSNSFT